MGRMGVRPASFGAACLGARGDAGFFDRHDAGYVLLDAEIYVQGGRSGLSTVRWQPLRRERGVGKAQNGHYVTFRLDAGRHIFTSKAPTLASLKGEFISV
jgi:hypothetical protein